MTNAAKPQKTKNEFYVKTQNGVVTSVSKSYILTPIIKKRK